jgi:uncharacterized protein
VTLYPPPAESESRCASDGSRAVRVALLADTHGWVDPRILDLVADCDLAVHCGDIGSAEVLARLRPRGGRVCAVRGNNDRPSDWPDFDRELLARIPEVLELPLPGGLLVAVHGHRCPARDRHRRLRERFPHARLLVYGHSHRLDLDFDLEPWVVNPGAAGRDRTYGGASCLVLHAEVACWRLETFRFVRETGMARPARALAKPLG